MREMRERKRLQEIEDRQTGTNARFWGLAVLMRDRVGK